MLFNSAWGLSMVTAVVVYAFLARRLGPPSLSVVAYGLGAIGTAIPDLDYLGVTVELFGLRWLGLARCLFALAVVGFIWSLNRIETKEANSSRLLGILGALSLGSTFIWISLGEHSP